MTLPLLGGAERLALIIETQRDLVAVGGDVESVMRLMAERCQALTGADGAMVSMLEGDDMLRTTAATGCASEVLGVVRPLAMSVARFAISEGRPLLIEDCESDPRINRDMQRLVGDKSLICVPLFHGLHVTGALNVMSRSETARLHRERPRDDGDARRGAVGGDEPRERVRGDHALPCALRGRLDRDHGAGAGRVRPRGQSRDRGDARVLAGGARRHELPRLHASRRCREKRRAVRGDDERPERLPPGGGPVLPSRRPGDAGAAHRRSRT